MFERYENDLFEGAAGGFDPGALEVGTASQSPWLGLTSGFLGQSVDLLSSFRVIDGGAASDVTVWSLNDATARGASDGDVFSAEPALGLAELSHAPSPAPLLMRPGKTDEGASDSDSSFTFSCGCGCSGSRGAQSDAAVAAANPGDAYGQGVTALIAQTFNSTLNRYEFTGDQNTDAVLIGSRWTATTLTFAFPTSGAAYANEGYGVGTEPDFHVAFNAAQMAAVRYTLGLVSAYTNLNFTEVSGAGESTANLRFSQTSYDEVPSAYANFPSSSMQSGDVWFGMTGQPFYDNPQVGNWGMATQMHEIGHALGLKHGHQDYTTIDLAGSGYLDHPSGTDPR